MRVDPTPGPAAVVPEPGVTGLVLQERDRRPGAGQHRVLQRLVVGLPRRGLLEVARGPGLVRRPLERHRQHRHALGRRERDVQEPHRLALRDLGLRAQVLAPLRIRVGFALQRRLVQLLSRPELLVRPTEQRLPARVPRVLQVGEDRPHLVRVDLAAESEQLRPGAEPQPRRLTGRHRSAVVRLPAPRDRLEHVVHVMPDRDAQHAAPPAAAPGPGTRAWSVRGRRPGDNFWSPGRRVLSSPQGNRGSRDPPRRSGASFDAPEFGWRCPLRRPQPVAPTPSRPRPPAAGKITGEGAQRPRR